MNCKRFVTAGHTRAPISKCDEKELHTVMAKAEAKQHLKI